MSATQDAANELYESLYARFREEQDRNRELGSPAPVRGTSMFDSCAYAVMGMLFDEMCDRYEVELRSMEDGLEKR